MVFQPKRCVNMGKRLNDDQRWSIIHEWKRHGNMAAIARNPKFPFSLHTIKHWVGVYKRTGTVVAKRPPGRPRRVNKQAARRAVDLLQDSERFGTAESVASELHKKGLTPGVKPVSKQTLIRAARVQSKADGDELQLATGGPKKELTAATKKKRVEFAKSHLMTNWSHVLFTDRKKFAFRYPGTKVQSKRWIKQSKGGKHGYKCFQPNNPQRVNLYMGICRWGVTKVHKVAGSKGYKSPFTNKKGQAARNITSAEYRNVLKETLLPGGSRLFMNNHLSTFTLQQDNDPSHVNSAPLEVEAWNTKHPGRPVTLLPRWPPNSPDLNPIENVWGIVQREADAVGCPSFDEFEALVIKKLQQFPRTTLAKLIESMKGRMQEVVKATGDKIKY